MDIAVMRNVSMGKEATRYGKSSSYNQKNCRYRTTIVVYVLYI